VFLPPERHGKGRKKSAKSEPSLFGWTHQIRKEMPKMVGCRERNGTNKTTKQINKTKQAKKDEE
jgi:hypothetical protein